MNTSLLGKLLCALALLSVPAGAATLVLQDGTNGYTGMGDVTLRSDQTGTNQTSTSNSMGTTSSASLREIESINLASLPANAVIQSVSFSMVTVGADSSSTSSNLQLDLYQLTSGFTPTQATWSQSATGTNWSTPGGSLGTLLSTATENPTTIGVGTTVTFGTSSSFVSALQTAYNSGQALDLLVKLDSETATREIFSFGSSTATQVLQRPSISITYSVAPEPASLSMLFVGLAGTGLAAWISRRRLSRG